MSNAGVTRNEFDGTRLALARTLRGLLKKELAEKINKTPAAIGQFEKGTHRPDPSTEASLAPALGVNRSFFTPRDIDGRFSADHCHFRSLRSSTTGERRHLLARGALVRDLVAILCRYVSLPQARIPQVKRGVRSLRGAEASAVAVRTALGLGTAPLGSVVSLLESRGVIVLPINQGGRRVSAFSTWTGNRPYIFLHNHDANPRSRTRFDNLHELGHLVMHADAVPGCRELEDQANRFASAFLLPKGPFLDECPSRLYWDQLRRLKRKWGVSLSAIIRRGYDLKRFSEATYRRAYVYLNTNQLRYNEPDEKSLEVEQPRQLSRAVKEAESEKGISRVKLARELGIAASDLTALIEGSELSGRAADEPRG